MQLRKDAAMDFWMCVLEMLSSGNGSSVMRSAIDEDSSSNYMAMEQDGISVEECDKMASDKMAISSFFDSREASVSDVFQRAMKLTTLTQDDISKLAGILADASVVSHYPDSDARNYKAKDRNDWMARDVSPKGIYNLLKCDVYGQEAAKRAVSMLVYHYMAGRSRHMVMAGPTGCGKTEFWRSLSKYLPGQVRVISGPQLSMDGWKGSLHFSDIFLDGNKDLVEHMILVIDEADKMMEPKVGSGGTDHARQIQNELLKIMDGDKLTYYADNNRKRVEVDCKGISVVLCGSFEQMRMNKKDGGKRIGLMTQADDLDDMSGFTAEDLVEHANMRREIAGRITRIVELDALDEKDFMNILKSSMSPLRKIKNSQELDLLGMDAPSMERLAHDAAESGMGCRFLSSKIQELLDEQIFDNPGQSSYMLSYKDDNRDKDSELMKAMLQDRKASIVDSLRRAAGPAKMVQQVGQ